MERSRLSGSTKTRSVYKSSTLCRGEHHTRNRNEGEGSTLRRPTVEKAGCLMHRYRWSGYDTWCITATQSSVQMLMRVRNEEATFLHSRGNTKIQLLSQS
jgi:hypothetical protein